MGIKLEIFFTVALFTGRQESMGSRSFAVSCRHSLTHSLKQPVIKFDHVWIVCISYRYACKAYCTARQELAILLTLRHANIVPLVGLCTEPLALVLELAPLGALDTNLRHYRRSGAKLNLTAVQQIVIQVYRMLRFVRHVDRVACDVWFWTCVFVDSESTGISAPAAYHLPWSQIGKCTGMGSCRPGRFSSRPKSGSKIGRLWNQPSFLANRS